MTKETPVSSIAAFKDGKLLFGLRRDSKKWTLPGGHANEGESPEKCAIRELLEETGLRPSELEFLGEGRAPYKDKNVRISAFKAIVEGEPSASEDPDNEIEEFRWVDITNGLPDDIAQNLFSPMNVTLRLLGLQGGKLLKNEFEFEPLIKIEQDFVDLFNEYSVLGNYRPEDIAKVLQIFNEFDSDNTSTARRAVREAQDHHGLFTDLNDLDFEELVADVRYAGPRYAKLKAQINQPARDQTQIHGIIRDRMGDDGWIPFVMDLTTRLQASPTLSRETTSRSTDLTFAHLAESMLEDPKYAGLRSQFDPTQGGQLSRKMAAAVTAAQSIRQYYRDRKVNAANASKKDPKYEEDSQHIENKSPLWHAAILGVLKAVGGSIKSNSSSMAICEHYARKALDSPEMRAEIGDPNSPENTALVNKLLSDTMKVEAGRLASATSQLDALLTGSTPHPADYDPVEDLISRSPPIYREAVNHIVNHIINKAKKEKEAHPNSLITADFDGTGFPDPIQSPALYDMAANDIYSWNKATNTARVVVHRKMEQLQKEDNDNFLLNPDSYKEDVDDNSISQRRIHLYRFNKQLSPEALVFAAEHEPLVNTLPYLTNSLCATEAVWKKLLDVPNNTKSLSGVDRYTIITKAMLGLRRSFNLRKLENVPSASFIDQMLDDHPSLAPSYVQHKEYLPYSTIAKLLTNPEKYSTFDADYSEELAEMGMPDNWWEEHRSSIVDAVLPYLTRHPEPPGSGSPDYYTYRRALNSLASLVTDNTPLHDARRIWHAAPAKLSRAFANRSDHSSEDIYGLLKHTDTDADILDCLRGEHADIGHVKWVLDNSGTDIRSVLLYKIMQQVGYHTNQPPSDSIGKHWTRELQERIVTDDRVRELETVSPYLDKDFLTSTLVKYANVPGVFNGAANNKNLNIDVFSAWFNKRKEIVPTLDYRGSPMWENTTHAMGKMLSRIQHQLPPASWLDLARSPNPNDRHAVASHEHLTPDAYKLLATDPSTSVREAVANNGNALGTYKNEILPWLAQHATDDFVEQIVEQMPNWSGRALRGEILTHLGPRLMKDDATMASTMKSAGVSWVKDNWNTISTNPHFGYRSLNIGVGAGVFEYGDRQMFDGVMEKILTGPGFEGSRGSAMSWWMNKSIGGSLGDYHIPSSEQLHRMADSDERRDPNMLDIAPDNIANAYGGGGNNAVLTNHYAAAIARSIGHRNFQPAADDTILERLARHRSPLVQKAVAKKLGPTNPDAIHTERVRVRFDTGKLRAIRDLIEASGKESLPAKDLPPMEWEVPVRDENGNVVKRKVQKRTGYQPDPAGGLDDKGKPKRIPIFTETEEVVKEALPVRDAKGNIHAGMIQKYIDNLPFIEFNISHGKWGHGTPATVDRQQADKNLDEPWVASQRHNDEYSKVFQLNITNHHVNTMKAKGSWQTYRNQAMAVIGNIDAPSHPVRPEQTTIGWIRYTGNPQEGLFIDEVQSDFGQSFVRTAVAQAQHLAQEAANGQTFENDEARAAFIENYVRERRADAEAKWPDVHNKNIANILFGGRHSNEIIHEAFHQYLRDRGFIGTKIAIHTPESKAPFSGLRTHQELPAHFKITYHDVPKKMGYQPSTYGSLPTQNSEDVKMRPEKPPKPEAGEKWATSKQTFETITRKYEQESYGLDCFYVLRKADDLAADAKAKFDADETQKWRSFFLDPETKPQDVVSMINKAHSDSLGKYEAHESDVLEAVKRRSAHAKDDANAPGSRLTSYLNIAHGALSRFPSDSLIEEITSKLPKYDPNFQNVYDSPTARLTGLIIHNAVAKASLKMLKSLVAKYTDNENINLDSLNPRKKALVNFMSMRANGGNGGGFDPETARVFMPHSDELGLGGETDDAILRHLTVGRGLAAITHDSYKAIFDEMGRKWANKPIDKYTVDTATNSIVRRAVVHGSIDTARHILNSEHGANVLRDALSRTDWSPDDLHSILDNQKFTKHLNTDQITRVLTAHGSFNQSHFRKLFTLGTHDTRRLALAYTQTNHIPTDVVKDIIRDYHDASHSVGAGVPRLLELGPSFRTIAERSLYAPEDIDTVLSINPEAYTSSTMANIISNPALTGAHISKILSFPNVNNLYRNIIKHPNFDSQHLGQMKRLYLASGIDGGSRSDSILGAMVDSPLCSEDDCMEMLNNPDKYNQYSLFSALHSGYSTKPRKFTSPKVAEWFYKNPDEDVRNEWARNYGDYRRYTPGMNSGMPTIISDESMRSLLKNRDAGRHIVSSHEFTPDMLRHIATVSPPTVVHTALSGDTHRFPPDALQAIFTRMTGLLDSFQKDHSADSLNGYATPLEAQKHPGYGSNHALENLLDHHPTNQNKPDLTPEQLTGVVDKFYERFPLIASSAVRHANFPMEKIRELAQWTRDPNLTNTQNHAYDQIKKAARERIGVDDPDLIHNEKVHIKFDIGKHRLFRDRIAASGKEELMPKEIPGLPNGWKIGRNKNGNINSKMIQDEIDKTPTIMYNISHDTYGGNADLEGSSTYECNACGGSGDVDYEHEAECGNCSGSGMADDEACYKCGGDGHNDCDMCSATGKVDDETCTDCGGAKQNECSHCEGAGNAPPPCGHCEGKGRLNGRSCYRCHGDGRERCTDCEGSGQITDSGTERCDECEGSGSITDPDYDPDEDPAWQSQLDSQQHNLKQSKVLQVNFTSDHVKKMREAGVWDTFRDMYETSNNSGHPVTPSTIGWIRYTHNDNSKDPRYVMDEIQSDFGQSFVRQAVADAIEEGKQRAASAGIPFNTPEWVKSVTDFAELARVEANKKWPEEHHKKISEILFGKSPSGKDRHSNEVLYEAFMQHLRDKGHHHAKVTLHHLITKAGISLRRNKMGEVCKTCKQTSISHPDHPNFNEQRFNLMNPSKALVPCTSCKGTKAIENAPCPLCAKDADGKPTGKIPCTFVSSGTIARTDAPGHFNVTYHDIPLANGMEPGQYGHTGNKDESNPKLKGQPVWVGTVKKYEDDIWGLGLPSRNLTKVEDHFGDSEWTFLT